MRLAGMCRSDGAQRLDIDLKIPENSKDSLPRWNSSYSVLIQECLTRHRHSGSKTALIRVGRLADNIHVRFRITAGECRRSELLRFKSQGTGVGIRGMATRKAGPWRTGLSSRTPANKDFRYFSSSRPLSAKDRARLDNWRCLICESHMSTQQMSKNHLRQPSFTTVCR